METDKIQSIIEMSYWKFAKTMPHIPHYYTLRMHAARDEDFVELVEFIRKNGYDENWGGGSTAMWTWMGGSIGRWELGWNRPS